ncbi:MAG: hypothetical protein KGL38_07345 [Gemmatimonadota bacterium]|nr:hypothetical protein [Gemmatimonadota bacterium]MDE3127803.1 hypothetical protein [Gemmatimonadota bacterium]MDE3215413.1 hypothetical protein [Gemmatimonadota bacterium]
MKKHRTHVPDFSHKRPPRPGTDDPKLHQPAPRPAAPAGKPRATSQKSGRRGQ